jgi:hypothetical protein
MYERNSGTDRAADGAGAGLEQQIKRLADERGALFDKSGASFGLSGVDQERLGIIERELDECFLARRRLRADRDARRFDPGAGFLRRTVRRA